jgi:hypothetical protein
MLTGIESNLENYLVSVTAFLQRRNSLVGPSSIYPFYTILENGATARVHSDLGTSSHCFFVIPGIPQMSHILAQKTAPSWIQLLSCTTMNSNTNLNSTLHFRIQVAQPKPETLTCSNSRTWESVSTSSPCPWCLSCSHSHKHSSAGPKDRPLSSLWVQSSGYHTRGPTSWGLALTPTWEQAPQQHYQHLSPEGLRPCPSAACIWCYHCH